MMAGYSMDMEKTQQRAAGSNGPETSRRLRHLMA
jgi:hypothetical protein